MTYPMPELHLFHSRRKCLRFLRKHGYCSEIIGTDAQMWLVDTIAVVLIEADHDWHSEAALLCHEAVHIADLWFEHIGEDNPGIENRAYMVQAICEPLFRAHDEWKQKRYERG